ncbi:hypothetical protein TGVAND_254606 [Toxoplasma gondii VAND]|uniref:Uncharacterized protein n=1 Tax=Toxoplasma gondii VAND TaxID=933077 RepID=A0A086Q2D8_TOXGO|nr:hypothetical protein TGVAND_254606 [Toxoplasma gondii VAND]
MWQSQPFQPTLSLRCGEATIPRATFFFAVTRKGVLHSLNYYPCMPQDDRKKLVLCKEDPHCLDSPPFSEHRRDAGIRENRIRFTSIYRTSGGSTMIVTTVWPFKAVSAKQTDRIDCCRACCERDSLVVCRMN